jgi:outer membrane protein assembly factor BamB
MKTNCCLILSLLALSSPLHALEPTAVKILPTSTVAGEDSYFGGGMAMNEKYLLITDVHDDARGKNAGTLYVCDPLTGNHLRQLSPLDAAAGQTFGLSPSLHGKTALIGAMGDDDLAFDSGAAYLFDVSTGAQLAKLTAPDAQAEDAFGSSTAMDESFLCVSAYSRENAAGAVYVFDAVTRSLLHKLTASDGEVGDIFGREIVLEGPLLLISSYKGPGGSSAGTVYIFDAASGEELHKLVAEDSQNGTLFGVSIAVSGHLALIGAQYDDDKGGNAGAAYVFDLRTGEQLRKMTASDGSSHDYFGCAVAVEGNLALIGAYGADGGFTGTGAVYLFDLHDGTELGKVYAEDHRENNSQYARHIALHGSTAIIGAGSDSELGRYGAAYLLKNLHAHLPVRELAQKADGAPLVGAATYSSFTACQMNADGEGLLQANLSKAPAGQTVGIWGELGGSLDLLMRTGDLFGSLKVSAIQSPIMQHSSHALFAARLSGKGVTALNDRLLVSDDGSTLLPLLREGDTLDTGGFSGQVVTGLGAMAASSTVPQAAVLTSLKAASTADSAIVLHDLAEDTVLDSLREGDESPVAGVNYGQISRVSITGSLVLAHVALSGASSANSALVGFSAGSEKTLIVRKGQPAPGTSGFFSRFKGECSSSQDEVLVRATLSSVPATTNEGLWAWKEGNLRLIAQKGTQVSGLTSGVKYAHFVRAWITPGERVLLLTKLSGTGVNTTNDQALLLILPTGDVHVLMREGEVFPGSHAGKIGTLQQVEVDAASGAYTLLGTLTGVSSTTNQGLWTGHVGVSTTAGQEVLLHPGLRLRKGLHLSSADATRTLTTMKLILPADSTGMGGRGCGSPVSAGGTAVQLGFKDGSQMIGVLD